ncbi:Membrane metalloendopeptidase-like protein [Ignavibacterium album JCM 16511]|uniref:Membrane metalloendopeptidase-like protein n=1 Tax=Ignavibacterium album (strain DSM 19864 / JCM 16511 / NBRC 101810 / Mat9-16) TaxID=945713 RepID=I0AHL9_IGNAJ|nr:M23 family metallopeptidase [Ignavibacterium album]AFH48476.1 Membrane metalloendopeptidase-like protein [Ignavibacterium album JCM 16511]
MKLKFDKKRLKKLTEFSVVLVPHDTSTETKTIKLSFIKITSIILIYSLIMLFIGFYIITFTSLDKFILPDSYRYNTPEKMQLRDLNEKIIRLATELEKLKSSNERLKSILMKQDSSIFNEENSESPVKENKKSAGGNVYAAFLKFISTIFTKHQTIIFIKPTDGYLSRKFDPENGHLGIDFATKENNPIFASAGGYISFAGYTPEYGYVVIVNHSDDFITRYMHCSVVVRKQGERVIQGEVIALAGNSGTRTTGTHLHFEIWHKGKPVDPEKFLIKF